MVKKRKLPPPSPAAFLNFCQMSIHFREVINPLSLVINFVCINVEGYTKWVKHKIYWQCSFKPFSRIKIIKKSPYSKKIQKKYIFRSVIWHGLFAFFHHQKFYFKCYDICFGSTIVHLEHNENFLGGQSCISPISADLKNVDCQI